MKRPSPRLVLIDLDGTLVDSVPDIARSVDEMMTALGLPERGERLVRDWIGNGVDRLVRRALVGAMEGEPEPDLLRRAEPIFFAAYARHNGERAVLMPGAREALGWLRGAGAILVCVTNKPAMYTEPLLRALGIRDHFSMVLSGDSLARRKPDPLPVLHALAHFSVDPGHALLIGDSMSDVRAARAARVASVCVGNGYNHGRDIRDVRPDAVIDSLLALPDLLAV